MIWLWNCYLIFSDKLTLCPGKTKLHRILLKSNWIWDLLSNQFNRLKIETMQMIFLRTNRSHKNQWSKIALINCFSTLNSIITYERRVPTGQSLPNYKLSLGNRASPLGGAHRPPSYPDTSLNDLRSGSRPLEFPPITINQSSMVLLNKNRGLFRRLHVPTELCDSISMTRPCGPRDLPANE